MKKYPLSGDALAGCAAVPQPSGNRYGEGHAARHPRRRFCSGRGAGFEETGTRLVYDVDSRFECG